MERAHNKQKVLRTQLKLHQTTQQYNHNGGGKANNRLKNLTKEGQRLDKTLAMTEEIIGLGSNSSQQMYAQQERLKKTSRNIKKIEKSAVPGLDGLITGIGNANTRNKIILSLIIAFCIVMMMYMKGFYITAPTGG